MESVWNEYLFPCLCAFMACVAFTLIFNIHGVGRLICGIGGALGWGVYLLCGSNVSGAFVAAVCIGVYSEHMARVRGCPVTGYLVVALLPLVPGGGVYYAMRDGLAGDTQQFLHTLMNTFGMACALAVGSMLSSSLFRAGYAYLYRITRGKAS